jgi:hypothetical protein
MAGRGRIRRTDCEGLFDHRSSITRSPASKPASILGHKRSIAVRSVWVRQLPIRTQMSLALAEGMFAIYRKSSSLLITTQSFRLAYSQMAASVAAPSSMSSTW